MANLVPELRTDSLGRTQRRWVRDQTAGGSASIPAPAPGPSRPAKSNTKRGTPKQRRTRSFDVEFRYDAADAELTDRIGEHHYGYRETVAASFDARDIDVLDVLSVASPANAALLLRAGARTADDALSILHEHKLDRLAVDNSEVTGPAEEREIPATDLLAFLIDRPDALSAPAERCVEAAAIYAHPGFAKLRRSGFGTVHEAVLAGRISAEDLRPISPGVFDGTSTPHALLRALEDIHSGKLDCTAGQLRTYLEEGEIRSTHSDLLEMLGTFGYDWVTREGRGEMAQEVRVHNRTKDRPVAEQKAAIEYWNELQRLAAAEKGYRSYLLVPEGLELWESGIPAGEAHQMLARGDSVERIVSAREQGIGGAVTSGWL